eukprot:763681-Hanusia_phi.AAC.4
MAPLTPAPGPARHSCAKGTEQPILPAEPGRCHSPRALPLTKSFLQARQNPQQQYYVQHQQPRAHGVVPQYHVRPSDQPLRPPDSDRQAPSAQPVLYGGFQQNW